MSLLLRCGSLLGMLAVSVAAQPGTCAGPAQAFAPPGGDRNGWGVDAGNSRYQPKPGLAVADVSRLKLKWAFGFPNVSIMFSQPVAAGGRIFIGSRW